MLQKDKRVNCLAWSRDDNCPFVEVVTCKDCKYWDEEKKYCKQTSSKIEWVDYIAYTSEDFYDVKFIKICKEVVKNYANEHHFLSNSVCQKDVFIIWYCKTLQNWKALAGIYGRDEYFELTYNGDEKELYLDVYKKSENICLQS